MIIWSKERIYEFVNNSLKGGKLKYRNLGPDGFGGSYGRYYVDNVFALDLGFTGASSDIKFVAFENERKITVLNVHSGIAGADDGFKIGSELEDILKECYRYGLTRISDEYISKVKPKSISRSYSVPYNIAKSQSLQMTYPLLPHMHKSMCK